MIPATMEAELSWLTKAELEKTVLRGSRERERKNKKRKTQVVLREIERERLQKRANICEIFRERKEGCVMVWSDQRQENAYPHAREARASTFYTWLPRFFSFFLE